ncbi:hypothetical protein RFI_24267, partial [Reticulomyxa filosa]
RPFPQFDINQLCEWIRENETTLLKDLRLFNLEAYLRRFFDQKIDGQRIDNDKWTEKNLLSALFVKEKSQTIDYKDRTVTTRLWTLVQSRKKRVLELQKKFPLINQHFSIAIIKDILKQVQQKWDVAKRQLQERTMTGTQIATELEWIAKRSQDDIKRQVRLMYEPHSKDPDHLKLSEYEQRDFVIGMPKNPEPEQSELETLRRLLKELEFSMPPLLTGTGLLDPVDLIASVKNEIINLVTTKQYVMITVNDIQWLNIVHRCGISKQMANWAKFVSFKTLFHSGTLTRFQSYQTIAYDLRQVFDCFQNQQVLASIRSVIATFSLIYKQKNKLSTSWEKYEWTLLKSFDNVEMKKILEFWRDNKYRFVNFPSVALHWLELVQNSENIILKCFNSFKNDKEFHEFLFQFAEDDPVQRLRADCLKHVRSFVVKFCSNEFASVADMLKKMIEIMQNDITAEILDHFQVVHSSWHFILAAAKDPQVKQTNRQKLGGVVVVVVFPPFTCKGSTHEQDREFLEQLTAIEFGPEDTHNHENYLRYIGFKRLDTQHDEKKEKVEMSQDDFEQLMARLLIFITGFFFKLKKNLFK